MRRMRGFGILVLTIVLASAWGCGSTTKQEGTGEYVDDSIFSLEPKQALIGDAHCFAAYSVARSWRAILPSRRLVA